MYLTLKQSVLYDKLDSDALKKQQLLLLLMLRLCYDDSPTSRRPVKDFSSRFVMRREEAPRRSSISEELATSFACQNTAIAVRYCLSQQQRNKILLPSPWQTWVMQNSLQAFPLIIKAAAAF